MKENRNDEILKMRKLMLHEVGVAQSEWTPNKLLILEGTNPGKFIEELVTIFKTSGKTISPGKIENFAKAIADGTQFSKISYNADVLAENLFKLLDDAPDVVRLGDDLTNSVRNEMDNYIKKNKLFAKNKGKGVDDISVTLKGKTQTIGQHIDDMMVPVIKDLEGAEASVKKILQDDYLLGSDINAEKAFAEIENQYSKSLKLIDPDGKWLKSVKEEYELIRTGYSRIVRQLDDSYQLSKAVRVDVQQLKGLRLQAAKGYSKAILDRLQRHFNFLLKSMRKSLDDFPKIELGLQYVAKALGHFKAWLEYGGETAGIWSKYRTNMGKMWNVAGTNNPGSIPFLNWKTYMDATHIPARVFNYVVQRIKNGKNVHKIKSVEDLNSWWYKGTLYGTGAVLTEWAWHGLDYIYYLLSLPGMAPDSYCRSSIIFDERENPGIFKDLPKQKKGGYSVSTEMNNILKGDGDSNMNFIGFNYDKFKDIMDNLVETPENETGQIHTTLFKNWTGNEGQIVDREKWKAFIGKNFEFNVPDWALAYYDCESGMIGFKIWDKGDTKANVMYEQSKIDIVRLKEKYKKLYNQYAKEIPEELKSTFDEKIDKAAMKFENLKTPALQEEGLKLTKACRESNDMNSEACKKLYGFMSKVVSKDEYEDNYNKAVEDLGMY
jgi:hypothetical protein